MQKFTRHLVIHADIIIEARSKKRAQEIYENITLLKSYRPSNLNPIRPIIFWDGELVDEETDWKELEE